MKLYFVALINNRAGGLGDSAIRQAFIGYAQKFGSLIRQKMVEPNSMAPLPSWLVSR